jgi:hypothetical protein
MNISGAGNTGGTGDATTVAAVTPAVRERTSRNSSVPPPPTTAAASADISKPGELFSKLQQLQQQDPVKFKEVIGEIAQSLHDAAGHAKGRGADFLTQLADRFDQAAQTGELPAPAPQESRSGGSAHGHHHHGHRGGGAVASALQHALDQVNQALTAGSAAPATPPTPEVPPQVPPTPVTTTAPTVDPIETGVGPVVI